MACCPAVTKLPCSEFSLYQTRRLFSRQFSRYHTGIRPLCADFPLLNTFQQSAVSPAA
jgi:hypothetical protein